MPGDDRLRNVLKDIREHRAGRFDDLASKYFDVVPYREELEECGIDEEAVDETLAYSKAIYDAARACSDDSNTASWIIHQFVDYHGWDEIERIFIKHFEKF
jgi:hypothetical protein